jgi:hypothetical protein
MNMITVNNKKAAGRWGQQASCMGRERERRRGLQMARTLAYLSSSWCNS